LHPSKSPDLSVHPERSPLEIFMASAKKTFVAVAAAIKNLDNLHKCSPQDMRQILAKDLARVFAQENPNFNMARFLAACEVPL
jgi:hypothetical protein